MSSKRPNLLYILSDQHAASVMGCSGDPVARTPHLDRLADRGVRLTNLYCPSPICTPSRMALLTGREPHENQVWTNENILSGAHATWPHALGAAGYRPELIGRLHSRGRDQLLGYAARAVGDHSPNHPGGPEPVRGSLHGTNDPLRVSLSKTGAGSNPYEFHDEDVTEHAVTRLDEIGRARADGDSTPFALSIGLMLPHQPYVANREDYDLFDGAVPPPRNPSTSTHPYHTAWRAETGIDDVTDNESNRARTAYYALVYRMDAMIGRILDALDRNDLASNTLVIYLSDHGDHLGEHGLWWKQTFFEESVRIPGIVSWPGHLPAGTTCERVASGTDLTATLVDAAGAPALPNSSARSMLPILTEGTASSGEWEDRAFSEYVTASGRTHRMLRRDRWKLCYYTDQPEQLFDLEADPHEQVDLGQHPDYAAVVDELRTDLLRDWDPEIVQGACTEKARDLEVLRAWAERVEPPEQHRWLMEESMSRLDQPQPA
ncbi:sulfatase-like hydrolase/transferase [Ruania alkalisoli]|uniref:Sulfatase-like hydrolase/transferase n=1 Tax=Ruania alkalisoli TaxID=2779775 RepID=A0A7M1SU64_9MICO|nr:sulfatase-like hydrolase/transferase [Ruania alkalisoli]QOR70484.1 sulfatase-like hydrolase/transferase [Ruania alkalisoli]